jgi:hypothetical protein
LIDSQDDNFAKKPIQVKKAIKKKVGFSKDVKFGKKEHNNFLMSEGENSTPEGNLQSLFLKSKI